MTAEQWEPKITNILRATFAAHPGRDTDHELALVCAMECATLALPPGVHGVFCLETLSFVAGE